MRMVNTRSNVDPSKYSKLEEFFKSTEDDAGTFLEAIKDIVTESSGTSVSVARMIQAGKPDKVKVPKPLEQHVSGFVRIICGWHGEDYVWHVEHAAIKRPWKVSIDMVIYALAKIMHANLPDIDAKIWPPNRDWELRTVTFKALGLGSAWSFDEEVIPKINQQIFEVMNTFV